MIVRGAGGSGKSVLLNTLVSTMRKMFQCNNVVNVVAPTGGAAFGVGGETWHSLFSMKNNNYVPGSLTGDNLQTLKQRLERTLAIFSDERSLVSSGTLGSGCQILSESLYNGWNKTIPMGGIPIFVMIGDDYQLPSVDPGHFDVYIYKRGRPKTRMELKGDMCWKEFNQDVMELHGSKRILRDDITAGDLVANLRVGTNNDIHNKKLMSLKLETIKELHGPETVRSIKRNALYLFANQKPIDQHNLSCLCDCCGENNPIAMISSESKGPVNGKAIARHFDDKTPSSCFLCRGCKVAINGRNFNPRWGLHNGAMGTIIDIIFAKDKNPNNGDLPRYVVVDFPLYKGPSWDTRNPTVSKSHFISFR